MKSTKRGAITSSVEVTHLSRHGFWLLLDDEELYLPFETFPWFRDARIAEVLDVQRPSPHHLYWPAMDVDIAVESIRRPEMYPLLSRKRVGKNPRGRPPARPVN